MTLPPQDPDEIEAARRGERAAWRALFYRWSPVVVGWCRYLGAGRVDPEDAAHEVFVRLHKRFDKLEDAAHFRAFLYGITRRVVAEERRKDWWRRFVPFSSRPPRSIPSDLERRVSRSEIAAQIDAILDGLPETQRELLVLCVVEGLTQSEAAELLSLPIGTVKSRMSRASEAFRAEAVRRGLTPQSLLAEVTHG